MALWVTPGPILPWRPCSTATDSPSISACHLRLTPLTQCAITRHVVGSAFRARLGIPQRADLHAGGPFVAIGGLLFMAIVEDAFPSRSDGRKQPLRPYRGSYAASEADHEYRHLISHRVTA